MLLLLEATSLRAGMMIFVGVCDGDSKSCFKTIPNHYHSSIIAAALLTAGTVHETHLS